MRITSLKQCPTACHQVHNCARTALQVLGHAVYIQLTLMQGSARLANATGGNHIAHHTHPQEHA